MADRYDVLEFRFEDTVPRPCQYFILTTEKYVRKPPEVGPSWRRAQRKRTCKNFLKLLLQQAHMHL